MNQISLCTLKAGERCECRGIACCHGQKPGFLTFLTTHTSVKLQIA